MKIGKLSVVLEETANLGKVFIIKASNNDAYIFDVSTKDGNIDEGLLTLRVSKDTALLLSKFIEEELSDGVEFSNATH